jgi:K+-transporting ATPase ATPase C chain
MRLTEDSSINTNEETEPPDIGRNAGWDQIGREVRAALTIVLILALLTGVLFPFTVVTIGQVVFPHQADGSFVRNAAGEMVGARLIGQRFAGSQYFHPRPSAAGSDGYNAAASSGLNLALTNERLIALLEERARAYRAENGLSGLLDVPADAITTSASGLDPHISPANALLQAPRVARARGMPEETVRQLVERHTDRRTLGFLGEPRVNVLLLNLALDEGQP